MKVLPQKELVSLRQREQEREAKSATKLAEDISKLHEQKETDAASLQKWRESTFRKFQEEVDEIEARKRGLERELVNLQKKRERLLEPLDEEWERFKGAQELHIEEVQQVVLQRVEIDRRLHAVAVRELEAQQHQEQATLMMQRAHTTVKQAETVKSQVSEELALARNQAHSIILDAHVKSEEASHLKLSVERMLVDVERRELELEHKGKEQKEMDRALKDKYETLLRTQKRINHV